ncbi:MAG: YihY family inner membrane protein [Pyrinomonadaceae bacterium]|nr:YihY family inner membrane protein [Phycisphaerales bacterium]
MKPRLGPNSVPVPIPPEGTPGENGALADDPPPRIEPARGGARRTKVDMIRIFAAQSQRSRLPQMAAALSYRTIFGLLPMIVVSLVVLKSFQSDQDIERMVHKALAYAGLTEIGIKKPTPIGAADESEFFSQLQDESAFFEPKPVEVPSDPTTQPVPAVEQPPDTKPANTDRNQDASDEITDDLQRATIARRVDPDDGSLASIVSTLVARASAVNFKAIGIIGGIMLIYAAISMLVEIERAFNQIYRVPVGKSWIRRIFQYWTILSLGSLLLFASFYVGEKFKEGVETFADTRGIDRTNMIWLAISGYGITVLVSTVLLLLMFLSVPNTRVRLIPALGGAVVAAILWEAGKWGFTQYLTYSGSSSYAQLYGSIALIPLFLLWIYVTWLIVLFGLHLSYHLQQLRAGESLALPGGQVVGWSDAAEPAVVDPASALAVMETVATGFRVGTPTPMRELVRQTRASKSVIEMICARLSDRGFLLRVAGGPDGNPSYALARPPESINAGDVLRVGYDLSGPAIGDGEMPQSSPASVVEVLRRAQIDAASRSTLAGLLDATTVRERAAGRAGGKSQRAERADETPTVPLADDQAPDRIPRVIDVGPPPAGRATNGNSQETAMADDANSAAESQDKA